MELNVITAGAGELFWEWVIHMKKSIRKMNQKTMSQSIKLAMGCGERVTPEVKKTYSRVGTHILKLLYDYDKDLFLSCFKKLDDGKEDMTGTDADGR